MQWTKEILEEMEQTGQLCKSFKGITNELYHLGPGVSRSDLETIAELSPAHLIEEKNNREEKAAYDFGTAFHSLILEPDLFEQTYTRLPKKMQGVAKRSNLDKQKWADYAKELLDSGKKCLDDDDWDSLQRMRDKLMSKKKISWLLTDGEAELTCYWVDEKTGILCKCRPDFIKNTRPVIVDLKIVGHKAKGNFKRANKRKFKNALGDYGYYIQAPYYLDGATHSLGRAFNSFVFIACEASPPYGVAAYVLNPRNSALTLEQGRSEYKQALWQYAWCKSEDKWPDYPDEIQPIDLPNWRITVNQN